MELLNWMQVVIEFINWIFYLALFLTQIFIKGKVDLFKSQFHFLILNKFFTLILPTILDGPLIFFDLPDEMLRAD